MKNVYHFLVKIGLDPLVFFNFIFNFPGYIRDYIKFKKLLGKHSAFRFGTIYPITIDKKRVSGRMKGAYFHQDLLVARKIYNNKPVRHIDIGSRTDGFVAHVAVFREIEVFDIRPQQSTVKNIIFQQADFMQLPGHLHSCTDSVSSLHAIEHFGLGRYGDPLDPDGHIKALENIFKMLKPEGKFYFAVPIGNQRIEYNAHRIFGVAYLLKILDPMYEVQSFSYVDDEGDLFEDVPLDPLKIKSDYGCSHGCGIFELLKKEV